MAPGECLGLCILGSDKTHLTVGQGDKELHAVYLTSGNIKKNIRTKVGLGFWVLCAQVPIAKFENEKLQGVFTRRVLNRVLDKVCDGFKRCARHAVDFVDPDGNKRRIRTFLLAYIADLPEQQALACVRQGYAPCSYARPKELGDSVPHALRRGAETLAAIQEIRDQLAEANAEADSDAEANAVDYIRLFKKAAEKYGLDGTDEPFWRDWLHADPSEFLSPEPLQQLWKFFWDHVRDWGVSLLGNKEFDRRLMCLQRRRGLRHFDSGITRFKQHSCREARDLFAVFLCIIAGHEKVNRGVMKAMQAFCQFVRIALYPSHSTVTLRYLDDAFKNFHRNKHHIAEAGLRNGARRRGEFNIPKLEQLWHYSRLIRLLGSVPQFSAEQTERLHIDSAKEPYRHTNRRGSYPQQICLILDRREKARQFKSVIHWSSLGDWTTFDQATKKKAIQRLAADSKLLPIPVRDVFRAKNALCNETTAFQLRQKPNAKGLSLCDVQSLYRVPRFIEDLRQCFLGPRLHRDTSLPFSSLTTWWQVRVQLKDPQDTNVLLSPLTVQASPPLKIGNVENAARYNFVLIRTGTAGRPDGLGDYGIGGIPSRSSSRNIFVKGVHFRRVHGRTAIDHLRSGKPSYWNSRLRICPAFQNCCKGKRWS